MRMGEMEKKQIDVKTAISLAMEKFKQEYGDPGGLSEGESYAVAFKNCTLTIGMKQGELNFELIEGEILYVNETIDKKVFLELGSLEGE